MVSMENAMRYANVCYGWISISDFRQTDFTHIYVNSHLCASRWLFIYFLRYLFMCSHLLHPLLLSSCAHTRFHNNRLYNSTSNEVRAQHKHNVHRFFGERFRDRMSLDYVFRSFFSLGSYEKNFFCRCHLGGTATAVTVAVDVAFYFYRTFLQVMISRASNINFLTCTRSISVYLFSRTALDEWSALRGRRSVSSSLIEQNKSRLKVYIFGEWVKMSTFARFSGTFGWITNQSTPLQAFAIVVGVFIFPFILFVRRFFSFSFHILQQLNFVCPIQAGARILKAAIFDYAKQKKNVRMPVCTLKCLLTQ